MADLAVDSSDGESFYGFDETVDDLSVRNLPESDLSVSPVSTPEVSDDHSEPENDTDNADVPGNNAQPAAGPPAVWSPGLRPLIIPHFGENIGPVFTLPPTAKKIDFLALLCATAQQSYCHHAGVRRPSVDIVFSETVKWIDTKFY